MLFPFVLGHIAENHTVVDILSDNCNNIIAKTRIEGSLFILLYIFK